MYRYTRVEKYTIINIIIGKLYCLLILLVFFAVFCVLGRTFASQNDISRNSTKKLSEETLLKIFTSTVFVVDWIFIVSSSVLSRGPRQFL